MKSTNLLLAATILLIAPIYKANAEEKFDPLALFEEDIPTGIGYSAVPPSQCFLAAEKGKILSLKVGEDQMKKTGEVQEVNIMSVHNGLFYYYFFDTENNFQVCLEVINE